MASGGNQDSVVRAWVDELKGDLRQIRLLPIRRPVRRVVLAVMQESQRLNIKLAETRPARARASPAACKRCVQLSVLMLVIVLPYFLYFVV